MVKDYQFEFKGQFLKELRDNTFSGSDHEDANEHIKKVLEIVDVFHISNITQDQEVILCYKGLEVPTRQILDSKGAIPTMTTVDARCMTRSSTKELLSLFENPKQKFRSNRRLFNTPSLVESNSPKFEHNFDIKEQSEEEGQLLKELRDNTFSGSEHKDANEHIEKVGCDNERATLYTDYPQKEEGENLEEAYNTVHAPYQPGGQYRAAGPGFYQQNSGNSLRFDRPWEYKSTDEQSLQERGPSTCPALRRATPRDMLNPISTAKADFSKRPHVDLGSSVALCHLSTTPTLVLGMLSHTRLPIELADRTIKQQGDIAANVAEKG
ncbi:hypothetical protein Tco_0928274 [Tanacetum coccineum]